jgi:hypothetical protein
MWKYGKTHITHGASPMMIHKLQNAADVVLLREVVPPHLPQHSFQTRRRRQCPIPGQYPRHPAFCPRIEARHPTPEGRSVQKCHAAARKTDLVGGTHLQYLDIKLYWSTSTPRAKSNSFWSRYMATPEIQSCTRNQKKLALNRGRFIGFFHSTHAPYRAVLFVKGCLALNLWVLGCRS